MIASSIEDAGVRYRIELRAIECQPGKEVRIREEVRIEIKLFTGAHSLPRNCAVSWASRRHR